MTHTHTHTTHKTSHANKWHPCLAHRRTPTRSAHARRRIVACDCVCVCVCHVGGLPAQSGSHTPSQDPRGQVVLQCGVPHVQRSIVTAGMLCVLRHVRAPACTPKRVCAKRHMCSAALSLTKKSRGAESTHSGLRHESMHPVCVCVCV